MLVVLYNIPYYNQADSNAGLVIPVLHLVTDQSYEDGEQSSKKLFSLCWKTQGIAILTFH